MKDRGSQKIGLSRLSVALYVQISKDMLLEVQVRGGVGSFVRLLGHLEILRQQKGQNSVEK